jgi:hypothetical protein
VPNETLLLPVLFEMRELTPITTFALPLPFCSPEFIPTATLFIPVVPLSALYPTAVLCPSIGTEGFDNAPTPYFVFVFVDIIYNL